MKHSIKHSIKDSIKKSILLITLIFTSNTFAFEKYVCQEYDRSTEKILDRTMVLNPTGKPSDHLDESGDFESTKIPYSFTLYSGLDTFYARSIKGFVYTEDVIFKFIASDSELSFDLYLDEMEEGYLKLTKDTETVFFVCR
jgi:hypothetical protein